LQENEANGFEHNISLLKMKSFTTKVLYVGKFLTLRKMYSLTG